MSSQLRIVSHLRDRLILSSRQDFCHHLHSTFWHKFRIIIRIILMTFLLILFCLGLQIKSFHTNAPFTMAFDLDETTVTQINSNNHNDSISLARVPALASNSERRDIPTSVYAPASPTDPLILYSNDANDLSNDSQAVVNQSISSDSNKTSLTTSEEESDEAFMSKIMIAYIIICAIGLCGNLVVILVILRFTKTESVTDIYVLNLAFADVMYITGLAFLITTMSIHDWIFGGIMCKIYMATTSLNQFASSFLLMAMSFDRFLAVCHPIYAQRFRQVGNAKIICLIIWFTCLILMIPILLFAKVKIDPENQTNTCTVFWPEYSSFNCEKAFTLCSFAIGFSLPLLAIAIFYICVVRKLGKTATGNLASSSRRNQRESTKRRVEFLVVGIICTYTACWLPYWIHQLMLINLSTTDREPPYEGFYKGNLIATILCYTNSALNPILYAFLSDNFKRRCSNIIESIYSCRLSKAIRYLCRRRHLRRPVTSSRASGEFEVMNRADSRQTVVLNDSVLRLTPSPNAINARVISSGGLPTESMISDGQTVTQTTLKPPEAINKSGTIRQLNNNGSELNNPDGITSEADTIVMPGLTKVNINHNII